MASKFRLVGFPVSVDTVAELDWVVAARVGELFGVSRQTASTWIAVHGLFMPSELRRHVADNGRVQWYVSAYALAPYLPKGTIIIGDIRATGELYEEAPVRAGENNGYMPPALVRRAQEAARGRRS